MAKVDAGRGKEPIRSSFDKDTRDVPAGPGVLRRNSSSTTGSDRSVPSGRFVLHISGNCPRCHHHHRSKKVHIRTRRLPDVTCEKCHTLWLGPGSKNATRLSLASRETIDPPPMNAEVRNLLQALRSINQVATTVSPTLPDIQEDAFGMSREHLITRSGSLRSIRSRLERSRRLVRLRNFLREAGLDTTESRSLDQNATVGTGAPPMVTVPTSLSGTFEGPGTDAQSAVAQEGQVLHDTGFLDPIKTMTPEQQFCHVRRHITASSARHHACSDALPQENDSDQDRFSLADIQEFLAGFGNGIEQQLASQYYRRNSDPSQSTTSLQISDIRTSEADTIVNDQITASPNLLREVLHRAYRLSVESSGQQNLRDGADRVDE